MTKCDIPVYAISGKRFSTLSRHHTLWLPAGPVHTRRGRPRSSRNRVEWKTLHCLLATHTDCILCLPTDVYQYLCYAPHLELSWLLFVNYLICLSQPCILLNYYFQPIIKSHTKWQHRMRCCTQPAMYYI